MSAASSDPAMIALAKAIRAHWNGDVRPLWDDLPEERRAALIDDAEWLARALERRGFKIVAAGRPATDAARIAELEGEVAAYRRLAESVREMPAGPDQTALLASMTKER